MRVALVPSALTTTRPPKSLKTRRVPSGAQAGDEPGIEPSGGVGVRACWAVPSAFINQIELVWFGRLELKAIWSPSGDQFGDTSVALSVVNCVSSEPSG